MAMHQAMYDTLKQIHMARKGFKVYFKRFKLIYFILHLFIFFGWGGLFIAWSLTELVRYKDTSAVKSTPFEHSQRG